MLHRFHQGLHQSIIYSGAAQPSKMMKKSNIIHLPPAVHSWLPPQTKDLGVGMEAAQKAGTADSGATAGMTDTRAYC